MLSRVILMVLVASTTAVSPPGPSCRLRLRQPLPQPPTYRPPYSPASYYPSTGGMWVCYTSYGYGGSVPYPYGSRPGYWPYGAAVATPVAATAPVPSAATATPIAVAPAAPPSIPYPAAARVAPTPVVAYPYYGGATQAQPVAFPYPYPGRLLATVRRARKTRSVATDEGQQQSFSSITENIPQAETLPSITDSLQADHPSPYITDSTSQTKMLPSIVEVIPQAEQLLPSSPASGQPLLAAITSSSAAGKLAVSVVFTSNSFMHNFFTHQLYPAVQALGIHLTLDLLPHPDGGCQPGSSKCLGSSLMVCAAEALPLTTAQLAFSACFMKGTLGLQDQSYPAVMNVAKMCMGPFSVLNWMQMAGCVSSGRGEQLFTAATKRLNLLVPGPQNAPIVAFNQEVVIADASALELFPTLLCQQLTQVPEASTFCSYNTLY
ncbi:calphotin-like [Portunus trituberculatus]|uniref:calphotin-like n=1 Tax=Portunus trituberculatus TaxID=210409 RepID=UPI001E1CB868|nr:calphotin-like [Portunus trituberculatus]